MTIRDMFDRIVVGSLLRSLDNEKVKEALTKSIDSDVIALAVSKTPEYQALMATVRSLVGTVGEVNSSIGSILTTLKFHQVALKDIIAIQGALANSLPQQESAPETLPGISKPSKPN
jgi:hypothetical protein